MRDDMAPGGGTGRAAPIKALAGAAAFLRGLPRDWVVSAGRTSIYRFLYQMVLPYLSLYTIGLGASGAQLGLVNCAGMATAAIISPFTGSLLDRIGPKRIYLVGIGLLASSWLAYALARQWPVAIVAMMLYYVGFRTSGHCCSVVCANTLRPETRATAMSLCETLAAGILGVVGPLIGAFVVNRGGGPSTSGIRPLFWIAFAGMALCFLIVLTSLSDRRWGAPSRGGAGFLGGLGEVFKHGKSLKRFIAVSVVGQLPNGMIIPFTQPFAASRGADEFVLGAMVTGFALTPLLLGIPAGRLADRIGRKRVLFITAPVFWTSCLLLVLARGGFAFIAAGVLQGALFISGVVTAALQFELVEPGYMGRWLGVLGFFQMATQALVALLAGLVWDRLGPQFVFLIPIALDLFVRMPLLATIPESRERD